MICTTTPRTDSQTSLASRRASADELRMAVGDVLAKTMRTNHCREKRRESRTPFPYLVKLQPADSSGNAAAGDNIVVVGKHLSAGGFDFYHREPLPFRWMIAWLESSAGSPQPLLVELLWCRFNKQGWYENGGRFVRLINSQQG